MSDPGYGDPYVDWNEANAANDDGEAVIQAVQVADGQDDAAQETDVNTLARKVQQAWNEAFTWPADPAIDYRMARIAAEIVLGILNGTGDPLTESQRFQVQESRDVLGTWDLARDGNPGIDRERVLADQVRSLLEIIDQVAPKGGG